MKGKITDHLIIAGCLLILGAFLINGIKGSGGGVVEANAAGNSPTLTQTVVATPTPYPQRLEAAYTGPAVIVGEKYDENFLTVTVVYNDGSQENVTDYTVSTEIVQNTGLNTIVVMYGDMVTKAFVYGRKLLNISVSPIRYEYGVGNMPDCRDLTVTGTYSDGTVEVINDSFDIYPEKLEKEGKQEITVVYGDKEASCSVFAKKWNSVLSINVSYNKDQMVTNMKIDRNDITVIAVYDDLTAERISTYTLAKEIYYDTGKQPLTVTYEGITKSVDIEVIERYIVGLKAEYTGGAVVVGRKYRTQDMHVYLQYVDGEDVETDDYTVHTRKIRYVGNNLMTVYFGDDFSASVIIEGIEESKPDFEYVSEGTATNSKAEITVSTAIPKYLSTDSIEIKGIKNIIMKKAYRKLKLKNGEYITFTYEFTDTDNESELPLQCRITIPEGYDMDHTFLYYTPNRKSILGRTNKTVIDERTFECTLFKVGTYMLVCSEELIDEE